MVRGAAGDRVDIFWHPAERLFRTEPPAAIDRQLVVELTPVPPPATHWQWCDLVGQAAASARECNWHSYDEAVSGEIEGAWSARRPSLRFVIGLSEYEVRDFNGSYATQHNLATGGQRMVRRGRLDTGAALDPGLLDESCALCTECFADTPQWPVHKTPCGHSFHFTCVQHLLRRGGSARCPICRRALPHAGGGRRRRSSRWRRWRRRTAAAAGRWTTGGWVEPKATELDGSVVLRVMMHSHAKVKNAHAF